MHAEVAVGTQHQAKGLRHAQQAFDILLEQLVQNENANRKTEHGHHRADRQPGQQQLRQHGTFGIPHVQPDE